jgi:zinc transporter ZupT
MNELLAKTVPLALGAMVSPTLLTAVILVLTGKVSPRARSWAFVAGGAAALAAFTLAVPWVASLMKSVNPLAVHWADIAFGLLLLGLAVRRLLTRNRPGSEAKRVPEHQASSSPRLGEYFGFGAVMIATDASSLVLYIAIMKEAATAQAPDAARAAAVAIGYVAVMLPAVVPACIATLAPKQTDIMLKPLGAWAKEHSTAITVVICVVFGAYLLVKGAAPLI